MAIGINLRTCQKLMSIKKHAHVLTTNSGIADNALHIAFFILNDLTK